MTEKVSLAERLFWSAYLAYHLRGQARYPCRPWAAIQRDQARRVRQTVAYAYRHVPYYRETMDRLGLRPADFQSADDLRRLPLLERAQVQRDPEYFVSTAQPLDRYLHLRSGGSTGAPVSVYYDTRSLFLNRAYSERFRVIVAAAVGQAVGYREAIIAPPFSSTQEVSRFCTAHSLAPPGAALHRQYLSLLDSPADNLARLNEFKPDVVSSYGSYLELLFAHVESTGASFHRPKAVVYSSDGLSASARRMIEERFRIPVFSAYRSIEAFPIGFECEQHRGYHLNLDLCPLRIVDAAGQTLPPGESGDVVVSNLVNRGTVLLNYRLGDLAALATEPCPCGRSLPLLASLDGRSDDWIDLADRRVHPQAVRTLFTDEQTIWQYQVVQRAPTHFDVAIVAMDTCDRPQTSARIRQKFAERFGPEVSTDIAFVDELPRTAGGKLRPVLALRREPVWR